MKTGIILDCLLIAGFTYFCFIPFDKKRIRARWANMIFLICGVIGLVKGIACLVWDLQWFKLDNVASQRLDALLYNFTDGLLLGFMLALVFSGQLKGTKLDPKQ